MSIFTTSNTYRANLLTRHRRPVYPPSLYPIPRSRRHHAQSSQEHPQQRKEGTR